jgi:hypothetical protein
VFKKLHKLRSGNTELDESWSTKAAEKMNGKPLLRDQEISEKVGA